MGYNVIGFCGAAYSGKDTAANTWLKGRFHKLALADPLKQECMEKGLCTHDEAWLTKPPHIRRLLQVYGTDIFRSLYPKFWVARWAEALLTRFRYSSGVGLVQVPMCEADCVAVPDVRFPDEVNFLLNDMRSPVVFIDAGNRVETKFDHASESYFPAIHDEFKDHPLFFYVANNEGLMEFKDCIAHVRQEIEYACGSNFSTFA